MPKNENDNVTTRECDLRHEPIDKAIPNLYKKQDRMIYLLLSGLILMTANLIVAMAKLF